MKIISNEITLPKAIFSNLFRTSKYNIFMQNWLIDWLIHIYTKQIYYSKIDNDPPFLFNKRKKKANKQ